MQYHFCPAEGEQGREFIFFSLAEWEENVEITWKGQRDQLFFLCLMFILKISI